MFPRKQFLKKKQELHARTHEIFEIRALENPCEIKGFERTKWPYGDMISSQPRYDHFDTAAEN